MKLLFRHFLLLMVFGFCAQLAAQFLHLPPDPNRPNLRIAPLQVRSLDISVSLSQAQAQTSIEQVFYNPGGQLAEGYWFFSLPSDSHINSFTMFINGIETRPELLDAEKARLVYENIVRQVRDPALLEFMGDNLFRVRVFPIQARSEKRIRLTYSQIVDQDEGLFRFSYPLRLAKMCAGPIGRFSFRAELKGETNIKTCYAPDYDFVETRINPRERTLELTELNFLPTRDVAILFSNNDDELGMKMLTHSNSDGQFFWMTLVPDIQNMIIPKDLVLIIDTSGSMLGPKMDQARRALKFCVDNLNKNDRFEIIRFSTEAESMEGRLLEPGLDQRSRAGAFIENMMAIGGTNLEDALRAGLNLPVTSGRPQLVLLITDGKPTIGERDEGALLELLQGRGERRFFCLGIGTEINTHLLDTMAEQTGGYASYISGEEDMELKISSLYNKIRSPVLGDVRFEVSGVKLKQLAPTRMPDLFRGQPVHIFGTYEGSGPSRVTLKGKIGSQNKDYSFNISFPHHGGENEFIPQIWARRRVGLLLDQIRRYGQDLELVEEVKRLALKYGIVTPYTSYLILEDGDLVGRQEPAPIFRREARKKGLVDGFSQRSGAASVSASKELRSMADSTVLAEPSAPESLKEEKVRGEQVVFTSGRAFYLQDGLWVDSLLKPDAKVTRRITFGEEDYFILARSDTRLSAILALGSRVRFLWDGQVYESGSP